MSNIKGLSDKDKKMMQGQMTSDAFQDYSKEEKARPASPEKKWQKMESGTREISPEEISKDTDEQPVELDIDKKN